MSTIQLFGSKGSTVVDLVNNIKLSIAAQVFQPQLIVELNQDDGILFKDSKSGFELIEANAIVKYLAKDFNSSSVISKEELEIYPQLKSNQLTSIKYDESLFHKVEFTPSQIILFSALYPTLKDQKDISGWFTEFLTNEKVAKAVKHALSITTLERPKEINTGIRKIKANHLVKPKVASIVPKDGERNILITSALPYVNNVPHLGNIVGSVLSADIYARYTKNRNYNSLFICGTDEYGTATETKALKDNVTPQELCDKYHKIHKQVYDWFGIDFDYFGRTPTSLQTEIAHDIFLKLYKNGYLEEKTVPQLYCESHNKFLADRYVEGTCPLCGYEDARGDQCDKCGNLLDPLELINPRCQVDNATPIVRNSTHVYLKLPELEEKVSKWIDEASTKGAWSKNSKTITASWIKKGLEPRCITRDLFWGTPVPLPNYEDKVLYVWFDATIGYISITANYFKEKENPEDWHKWWNNPDNVDLYQFMGKDNVPFHTVVFPASLIGTGDVWTKLHHLSTTEYLQYEGGKFSKSRGVGVFGNNAEDTGIPPSVWRYYLASVRPESSDSHFSWEEFVTKNNSELLANLGNFVNRIVKFAIAKYNGVIPKYDIKNIGDYEQFESDINGLLTSYIENMEAVNIRKGLETAMAISARGNQFLQDNKLDNSLYANLPDKSDAVVAVALNLVYLVSAVIAPFIPDTTAQINEILNAPALSITDKFELVLEEGHNIGKAQYLFKRIDEKKIEEWRAKYGGQDST
ncbi:methionyl tRNA synthetase [Scheffersomyces amazonensis]|uniref:methionyl tRNA synthetase n=1 Tax=Scheffersomyces amazonensis TaxID=1078765 RepID=UPI00315DCFCD